MGKGRMAVQSYVPGTQSLSDRVRVLVFENRDKATMLAFANADVLQNLKGVFEFRTALRRNPSPM
jgi:hypothetical protein